MSECVGKIEITEDKIVTTKVDSIETWAKGITPEDRVYIVCLGEKWRLVKKKTLSESGE